MALLEFFFVNKAHSYRKRTRDRLVARFPLCHVASKEGVVCTIAFSHNSLGAWVGFCIPSLFSGEFAPFATEIIVDVVVVVAVVTVVVAVVTVVIAVVAVVVGVVDFDVIEVIPLLFHKKHPQNSVGKKPQSLLGIGYLEKDRINLGCFKNLT